MGELLDYFKEKYSSSDKNKSKALMEKQRVRTAIEGICEKYLKDADDTLTFEVSSKDLPYAVMVISEDPLISKYEIYQISESMFSAYLKTLDI